MNQIRWSRQGPSRRTRDALWTLQIMLLGAPNDLSAAFLILDHPKPQPQRRLVAALCASTGLVAVLLLLVCRPATGLLHASVLPASVPCESFAKLAEKHISTAIHQLGPALVNTITESASPRGKQVTPTRQLILRLRNLSTCSARCTVPFPIPLRSSSGASWKRRHLGRDPRLARRGLRGARKLPGLGPQRCTLL